MPLNRHSNRASRETPKGFAAGIVAGFSGLRRWKRIACAATAAGIGSLRRWPSAKGWGVSIISALSALPLLILWSRSSGGSTTPCSGGSSGKSGDGAERGARLRLARRFLADALGLAFVAIILSATGALAWALHFYLPAVIYWVAAALVYWAALLAFGVSGEVRAAGLGFLFPFGHSSLPPPLAPYLADPNRLTTAALILLLALCCALLYIDLLKVVKK